MIKVLLDILAQIILSSLRFAQECFKVKLISKSHNCAITRRYGLAIEASYSPEYRSLLSRNVFVYVYKLKQRRNTDFLFHKILLRSHLLAHPRKPCNYVYATTAPHSLGRQLKFQGLTRQEWVIRVGPEYYLILEQNDQDISFSIVYDLLL